MTNILVISLDDMAQRLGANLDVLTMGLMPRVESMIGQGTLFNQAYAPGAQCLEVRGAVMHSVWPTCSNIIGKGVDRQSRYNYPKTGSDIERFSIDWWFQQNGYNTYGYGKNHHTAEDSEPGWDLYYDLRPGFPANSNQWPNTTGIPLPRNGYPNVFAQNGGPGLDWGTWPTLTEPDIPDYDVTQQWISDMQNVFQADWFSMVGFNYPHLPIYLPEPWASMYDNVTINPVPLQANDTADMSCPPATMYTDAFQPFYEQDAGGNGDLARQEMMRWTMKCLTYIDHLIDDMMTALAASPFANDTIVVIMSDHGRNFGEKERWNKGDLWEQVGNQFMLFWQPGVIPAQQIETPVDYINLMPTLSDLAGIPQRDAQQGKIMTPLILQGANSPDWCDTGAGGEVASDIFQNICPDIASHFWSWRKGQYKIIWYGSDNYVSLYDVVADPYEFNNLAASNPALVQDMLQGLKQHHACIENPALNHPVNPACVAGPITLNAASVNGICQIMTIDTLPPGGQLFQYDGSNIGAPIAAGDQVNLLPGSDFVAQVWYVPGPVCNPAVDTFFEWTSTDMNRPWNSAESRATLTNDEDFCVSIGQ